jgi:hypothetical protein
MKRVLIAAAALTVGASVASAATLDVKTGLWEVTSQGETTGMPPIPPEALAHMTPEQRAKIQQSMADAMGRSGKPDVNRSCITEKALQRGLDLNDRDQPNCTRNVTNSSSRQLDVTMQCTGQQKMNGMLHIEAVDRQTMRGNFNLVTTDGTNTMTVKRTMNGKWLGSDCGNVKPSGE